MALHSQLNHLTHFISSISIIHFGWCWVIFVDDLSSDLTFGATNNLANAGSGLSSLGAVGMNIIDNRPLPPPPPHTNLSNLLHMAGN